MKESSFSKVSRIVVLSLVVLSALAACSSKQSTAVSAKTQRGSSATDSSSSFKAYAGSDVIIGSADPSNMTVSLNLVGGEGNAGSGFNFNGYANGDMIIRVPAGWKVSVNFTVDSSLSHSVIVAPWNQRQAGSFTEAFSGAAIPDYSTGIHKGDPAAHFSFSAATAGKYAIVCAVPGHDDLGMWDELDVVTGLTKPQVLVR